MPPRLRAARAIGLLCLGLVAATHVLGYWMYLRRLDTSETPYSPSEGPWQRRAEAPEVARRVMVVVFDGLRDDVAIGLPNVEKLAARGVRRELRPGFPSFTRPALTTLATGVPPAFSGVRLNTGRSRLHFDSLIDSARRAGVGVAFAENGFAGFGEALDRVHGGGVEHAALPELSKRPARREIVFVHLDDVDAAGHWSGARSARYLEAAGRVDVILGELAAGLSLDRDVLVALSDHGHRDRGGHGGDEAEAQRGFLLLAGAGVRQGVRLAPGRLVDLAPTIALLAGIAPPRDNLGAPMLDALSGRASETAKLFAPAFEQRGRADSRLFAAAGSGDSDDRLLDALIAGDADAIAPALATLAAREERREARRIEGLDRRLRAGLMPAAAVALLLAIGLVVLARRLGIVLHMKDFIPITIYFIVYTACYGAAGYGLSFSIPHGYVGFYVETGVIGLAAGALALWMGRRRFLHVGGRPRTTEQALPVAWLWVAYPIVVALSGIDPAWLERPAFLFVHPALSTVFFYAGLAFGPAVLFFSRQDA